MEDKEDKKEAEEEVVVNEEKEEKEELDEKKEQSYEEKVLEQESTRPKTIQPLLPEPPQALKRSSADMDSKVAQTNHAG